MHLLDEEHHGLTASDPVKKGDASFICPRLKRIADAHRPPDHVMEAYNVRFTAGEPPTITSYDAELLWLSNKNTGYLSIMRRLFECAARAPNECAPQVLKPDARRILEWHPTSGSPPAGFNEKVCWGTWIPGHKPGPVDADFKEAGATVADDTRSWGVLTDRWGEFDKLSPVIVGNSPTGPVWSIGR